MRVNTDGQDRVRASVMLIERVFAAADPLAETFAVVAACTSLAHLLNGTESGALGSGLWPAAPHMNVSTLWTCGQHKVEAKQL